jgi:hypothetical protein
MEQVRFSFFLYDEVFYLSINSVNYLLLKSVIE